MPSESATSYRLTTFGSLTLLNSSGTVLAENTKPLLLLAFLALQPDRRSTRDYVAELFWPDADFVHRRASLRQALYQLRSLAPGLGVRTNETVLNLERGSLALDRAEFARALRAEHFEAAVDIAGTPFLEGVEVGFSRELEHWMEAERERINAGLQVAFQTLIRERCDSAELDVALRYARAFVQLNPLSESARLSLVRVLKLNGDHIGALQTFEEYRALVKSAVDDEPGSELTESIRRIREAATRPLPPRSALPVPDAFAGARRGRTLGRGWALAAALAGVVLVAALVTGSRVGSSSGAPSSGVAPLDSIVLPMYVSSGGSAVMGDLRISRRQTEFVWGSSVKGGTLLSPDGRRRAHTVQVANGQDLALTEDGATRVIAQRRDDEVPLDWSPDGRFLLYRTGRLENGEYVGGLWVWDSETETQRRLSDLAPVDGAWSPDGTRIAVLEAVGPGHSKLVLADPGGRRLDEIPLAVEEASGVGWSPMGDWLTFQTTDGLDLDIHAIRSDGSERRVIAATPAQEYGGTWLSTGHLAYTVRDEEGQVLVVRSFLGEERRFVFDLPEPASLGRSTRSLPPAPLEALLASTADRILGDGPPKWIESITIDEPKGPYSPGERLHLAPRVFDARGEQLVGLVDLTWISSDTVVARVTRPGVVRALESGRAFIVASFPGWRADTVALHVARPTRRDISPAFFEDWTRGILPERWSIVGEPTPVARPRGAPTGGVLFNNGDQNHESGVLSRSRFSLEAGLTVEYSGRAPLTGGLFQNLVVSVLRNPLDPSERKVFVGPSISLLSIGFGRNGRSELVVNAHPARGAQLPTGTPLPEGYQEWRRYAIQLHPEGDFLFFVDDLVHVRGRIGAEMRGEDSVVVALSGASVGTEMLFGPVAVYEGLLYEMPAPPEGGRP